MSWVVGCGLWVVRRGGERGGGPLKEITGKHASWHCSHLLLCPRFRAPRFSFLFFI